MRKILSTALIMSAMVASVILSAQAAVVERDEGYISLSATESKEVTPNQASITVNIQTSDVSLQKASDDNKIIAQKVYNTLKAVLGSDAGNYIKTGNFSAVPTYSYTKDSKKVFDKYVVTNNVVVKTKNIEIVSKLIDSAIASGATEVNDLQFLVSDYDSQCSDMLSGLIKKTYNQANLAVSSINQKVIATRAINVSCSSENNQRNYYLMAKSSMDSSSAKTPVEGGKIKIYATVDASYYVVGK